MLLQGGWSWWYHSIGDEVICHKQRFNGVFWIKDWTPPPPLIKQIYGSTSEVHLTDRILEKELFYTKVLLQIS